MTMTTTTTTMKERCGGVGSWITVMLLLLIAATVTTGVSATVSPAVVAAQQKVQYLLQHAIPVDRNGHVRPQRQRSLNQNNEDQQQFEISGAYTVQFFKCASVSSQPYDDDMLFDSNLLPYTTKGQIAAQKSFVLFNLCETQYCDFYTAGDENLYMVDVATYMTLTTVNYEARKESYCTACASSENYCAYVVQYHQHGVAPGRFVVV
jgi:hypothetical protein